MGTRIFEMVNAETACLIFSLYGLLNRDKIDNKQTDTIQFYFLAIINDIHQCLLKAFMNNNNLHITNNYVDCIEV